MPGGRRCWWCLCRTVLHLLPIVTRRDYTGAKLGITWEPNYEISFCQPVSMARFPVHIYTPAGNHGVSHISGGALLLITLWEDFQSLQTLAGSNYDSEAGHTGLADHISRGALLMVLQQRTSKVQLWLTQVQVATYQEGALIHLKTVSCCESLQTLAVSNYLLKIGRREV